MYHGDTQLTLILSGAHSHARFLVSMSMAAFDAAYIDPVLSGIVDDALPMLMMLLYRRFISGSPMPSIMAIFSDMAPNLSRGYASWLTAAPSPRMVANHRLLITRHRPGNDTFSRGWRLTVETRLEIRVHQESVLLLGVVCRGLSNIGSHVVHEHIQLPFKLLRNSSHELHSVLYTPVPNQSRDGCPSADPFSADRIQHRFWVQNQTANWRCLGAMQAGSIHAHTSDFEQSATMPYASRPSALPSLIALSRSSCVLAHVNTVPPSPPISSTIPFPIPCTKGPKGQFTPSLLVSTHFSSRYFYPCARILTDEAAGGTADRSPLYHAPGNSCGRCYDAPWFLPSRGSELPPVKTCRPAAKCHLHARD